MFGITIYRFKMTHEEVSEWLHGQGLLCLPEEEYMNNGNAKELFNEMLTDHYNEIGVQDDHDYTFNDWCDENEMFYYQDLISMGRKWNWEIVEIDDIDNYVILVLALEE